MKGLEMERSGNASWNRKKANALRSASGRRGE
jgi:hypothetical protein